MTEPENVTILLCENDPGHARLIEKNLRRAGVRNELIHFGAGREVLDFLFCQGTRDDGRRPAPLLLLLDLNMSDVGGLTILKRVKDDERTRRIPVLVLTTADDPREISRCYELGCNVYVTKPVEYEQFAQTIRDLGLLLSVMAVPQEPFAGAELRG